MSQVSRIAQRYGASFFEAAVSTKQLEKIASDCIQLVDLLSDSPSLSHTLHMPTIPREQMEKVLVELADTLKLKKLTVNFLRLLAQKRRTGVLGEILKQFNGMVRRHNNQLTVDITSRDTISSKQLNSLQKTLSENMGKDIILNQNIDPSILGGVIINYESYKLDFSLKRKLNELKYELERLG